MGYLLPTADPRNANNATQPSSPSLLWPRISLWTIRRAVIVEMSSSAPANTQANRLEWIACSAKAWHAFGGIKSRIQAIDLASCDRGLGRASKPIDSSFTNWSSMTRWKHSNSNCGNHVRVDAT